MTTPITPPTRVAHPAVTKLFECMRARAITYRVMEKRSGVSRHLLAIWHRGGTPKVPDLEAALNVVGLHLVTRTKADER